MQQISLIDKLEQLFIASANPEKGLAMSNYMKGLFPFYGIGSVERKAIVRAWSKHIDLNNRDEFWELIKELWSRDQREYQYTALDLLLKWKTSSYHSDDHYELEWLIRNRSWWDTVDLIASNNLGKYVRLFPEQGNELIEEWRQSGHLWLQRSCLIFQLKYGNDTDRELLTNLIKEFVSQKEFFIQKAIGWSLRQLSKRDPESVKRILKEIPLKGIALREATKYL